MMRSSLVATWLCATLLSCADASQDAEPTFFTSTEELLPPLASAGSDRSTLKGLPVTLNGSGTYHPLGQPVAYEWVQVSGPPVFLSNPASTSPRFVAPTEDALLIFGLLVTDGVFTTYDEVRLLIGDTEGASPRIRARSDYTGAGQDLVPPEEIARLGGLGQQIIIETIEPTEETETSFTTDVLIARIRSSDGTLRSAPDYVLAYGNLATTSAAAPSAPDVDGPTTARPGETVTLTSSAPSASTRVRWEQFQGSPVEIELTENGVAFEAPSQSQQLWFRAFSTSGDRESRPTEHLVVVGDPDISESSLAVFPEEEVRTRPGRQVVLDALAGLDANGSTPASTTGTVFRWEQTAGPVVSIASLDASTREIQFQAPEAPATLAFAVRGIKAGLEGTARVTIVTSLSQNDNLAPEIVLEDAVTESDGLNWITVEASVSDPESDATTDLAWVQLAGDPISLVDAIDGDEAPTSLSAVFKMPSQENWFVRLSVTVCDVLQACTEEEIDLGPATPNTP